MSNLLKRIYYAVCLNLETPLCISNGENELTDCDVIRTWDGKPFIPGTSFAGAMRTFCKETGVNEEDLFGSSEDDGKMSRIWMSDFYFDSEIASSIRDGVKLKEKIAVEGGKYDYEILEHGSGVLYLQLYIWDDMQEETAKSEVKKVIRGIHTGDIRLGAQKNRGLGKLSVEEVYEWEFSEKNVDEWIGFTKEKLTEKSHLVDFQTWEPSDSRYITITVPLELTGGLSIRQYSTKVNEPDFVSLMRKTEVNQECPVIPGSSWKGAIRSRMEEILKELKIDKELDKECQEIWGYVVQEKKKSIAKASEMIVSESILKEKGFVRGIRNRISRFENATVQGALYQERCAVQGNTELEMKIKQQRDTKWFIGLLLLVVKDIQKGYLSIGGGAAIGRGIFKENGEIKISSGISEEEYIKALREKVSEVKQK